MSSVFVFSTFIADSLLDSLERTPSINLKRTHDVTTEDTFRMLKVLGAKDCQLSKEEI